MRFLKTSLKLAHEPGKYPTKPKEENTNETRTLSFSDINKYTQMVIIRKLKRVV